MKEYELKQKGRWVYLRPFPEPRLLHEIKHAFSYTKKGAEFMPNPLWSVVRLFQEKRCRVPIGLLHKLKLLIKNNGDTYDVSDNRAVLTDFIPKDDGLYNFQTSALRMALLRRGGILQIPTGGGKTRTALSFIDTLDMKTLVIVPTLDLVKQWKRQTPENVEVRTYQSLKSKSHIQQFGLVVFDECHNVAAKTLQMIGLNLNEEAITLGLSATPFMRDDDNLKVESILGPVIYKISLRELIKEGYLVDALVHFHRIHNDNTQYLDYHETYDNFIVNNDYRNEKILQLAQESKGHVLILVKIIDHGTMLKHSLEALGEDVVFLNGSSKNRDDTDHRIIIATSIYDEGVDIPHLKNLILAGGGKSAIKTTQRIGRVLRKYPGKTEAIVHDFIDDSKYLKIHSLHRKAIYELDFEVVEVQ